MVSSRQDMSKRVFVSYDGNSQKLELNLIGRKQCMFRL
jgi:hypothetical protein